MARLYNTGFELNSAAAGMEVTAVGGSPTVQNTTVRSGSRAAQITGLASGTAKGFRENFATSTQVGPFWFRTYFRYATAPTANNTIIQVNDTNAFTTQLASIELTSTGTLQLRDEDGTIGSPSSAMSANTWYMIEFRVDNTGGVGAHLLEARLNGSVFATASNRSLSANFITFNWGGNLNAEAQTTGNWYFDDIAINDGTGSFQNGYPGEGELIILRPTGDSSVQWARGGTDSGANWSQLDESPPNDVTDYVSSNTLDQIDLYTLEDTPAAMDTTDVINCVMPGVRVGVDNNTGSDPDITIGLSVSGNVDETAAIDVSNAAYFTNNPGGVINNYPALGNNSNYEVPGTNTAWTKSDLDSALFRLRQAASDTHFARVTAVWVYVDHKPASGTLFTQSASGGITPSGVVLKQGNKPLAGGNTPAGAVNKSTTKSFTGSNTPSGSLLKQAQKLLEGALSSISGTLTTARIFLTSLSGSITPSGAVTKLSQKVVGGTLTSAGTLAKNLSKLLAGTIVPTGALLKSTSKSLSGALSSIVGTLTKQFPRSFSGSITPSGTTNKSTTKTFSGGITPSGAISKLVAKIFSGSITPTGALTLVRTFVKSLSGTLTSAGTLAKRSTKSFTGSLTPAGSLLKQVGKFFSGVLTLAGSLATELIEGGGDLFLKALDGAITPSGNLSKTTNKLLSGIQTLVGSLSKLTNRSMSGSVTPSGTISKQARKILSGVLNSEGALATIRLLVKVLEGGLSFTGSLSKSVNKRFQGTLTSSGFVSKVTNKVVSGTLLTAGGIIKGISKALSGLLSFVGNLITLSGIPAPQLSKIYLLGTTEWQVFLDGQVEDTILLSGERQYIINLQGDK